MTTSICTFANLAIAAVQHLGLHKSISSEPSQVPSASEAFHADNRAPRTGEEQRAVLGCFLLTSSFSSSIKIIDSLRWTPHMEECLRDLDGRREHVLDQSLVQQVRLQLVAERATLTRAYENVMEPRTTLRPSPVLYAQALLSHLDEIRTSTLPVLHQCAPIQLHAYAAQLSINEVALSGDPAVKDKVGTSPTPPNLSRLKHLHASLHAIKSWLEVFFSLPLASFIGLPTCHIFQFRHCMGMLFVLSTLEDASWSAADVRADLDILAVVDRVSERFRRIAREGGIDAHGEAQGEDVWTRAAERLQGLKHLWAGKLTPRPAVLPVPVDAMTVTPAMDTSGALFANWSDLDFSNFDWVNSSFLS
ncbi:hypothetical protein LTR91_003741 [Friedmanniomyces endolithicus]|uniref:Transcription factor domain-containing protein n=2 Tax=Friedmanniomyces endolithicus TaxID=329885 RepID=A0AAN6QZM4_9PEZI|nr:hypothetical protein LTR94_014766 [Friedmanniomyces endolithicus]KAK0784594.1 hypothetical protein LTR38_012605 [Friedmanniomyces endolithicus]KAK0784829.1 hypothetical protein LTR59_011240 [Friedmanniomyces endolithicus]KAK0790547.1 hypothetical protein LTR75_012017 [Friedmanniomyces endolithicus]KAK0837624.1 hypothetical protein LTR03_012674 [Friedmanniomyces endolithicus]